jgi:hypothetical protein
MDKLPATLQFLGPEKKREQDTVLRMMCVEILLLLSTSEFRLSICRSSQADRVAYTGRQSMRDRGTYYVIREAHKVETDQPVCSSIYTYLGTMTDLQIKEAIERLVALIEGEESHETRGQHVEELLKADQAKAEASGEAKIEEVNGEMDVVEV